MDFKIFYGLKPRFTQRDAASFSGKGYECRLLLQNQKGDPVTVSQHEETDTWRVQYGFSSVFFATYKEALAFCKGKFLDLDGRTV